MYMMILYRNEYVLIHAYRYFNTIQHIQLFLNAQNELVYPRTFSDFTENKTLSKFTRFTDSIYLAITSPLCYEVTKETSNCIVFTTSEPTKKENQRGEG